MKVKVDLPKEKSKSRKVNKAVKLEAQYRALTVATDRAKDELSILLSTLNGSQLAEYKRIISK